MPGTFGIIARNKEANADLQTQFDRMASLLKHFDYYETEQQVGDGFIFGRVGIPYRGHKFSRYDEKSGKGVVFDGYMYGWRGESLGADPARSEPVSILPISENSSVRLEKIPSLINGSFVISLFDKKSDSFYLANDRFGFRALYYYQDDNVIAFAPEIKAFRALDSFKPELDYDAVSNFFNYGFLIGGLTLYKNVSHLYPASIIKIKNRTMPEPELYWKYRFVEEVDGDADKLVRQMYDLSEDVLLRQIADQKKFVMSLSGGMDSRIVAWQASKYDLDIKYYTHGHAKNDDAILAAEVAEKLGVSDNFKRFGTNPECYWQLGNWTCWIVEGMADISCSSLADTISRFPENPLQYEFLNSLYTGAMNFAVAYGRETDIRSDFSFEQKMARIKHILGYAWYDDAYYNLFASDYRQMFRSVYDKHITSEFEKLSNTGDYFINQMDTFFLQTRILRYSNHYDLNRFFYHDHFAQIDDEAFEFYLKMPMKHKALRNLYLKMYQDLMPEMAKIRYQKTGVDLYSKPTASSVKWKARKARMRYLIGRLSMGKINLYDNNNYVQLNQWYRQYNKNRQFFESLLLDKRTLDRGFYNEEAVMMILKKQVRGSSNFHVISNLATFELFNRYFIDGDSSPSFPA